MNSEVDINVLISIYNQKIAALTNQNILLEAKLQSSIKDFQFEKEQLLAQLLEAKRGTDVSLKSKINKKSEDFQNSEDE